MVQAQSSQFPLTIGSPDEFAQVNSTLRTANFTEEVICKTAKVEALNEVGGIDMMSIDFSQTVPAFRTLFFLFFGQRPLPAAEVEKGIGEDSLRTFKSLGLICDYGADKVYARVLLYPVSGFYVASDRHSNPDGSVFIPPADVVFPAIFGGTLRFLKLLPLEPADEALDLCAGSGIGAFVLSLSCRRSVSSDLTQRATHFANFNRLLNGLENVEVVCGDLYSGVAGRTFDRIVAHPPYVPSVDNATIWRDGGITGEEIGRRVIEGLPEFLRPGGLACVLSLGVDTKDARFEERIRGWLGAAGQDFDIIFASTNERSPSEILRDIAARDPQFGIDKQQALQSAFADAGIVKMPHGAIALRRHRSDEQDGPWTLRTKLSDATEGADFERVFRKHSRFEEPGFVKALESRCPRLADRLQVVATHVVLEGSLVPAEFIFETDKPFDSRGRMDSWMVPLFARLDGKLSLREIYDQAVTADELPEGFQLTDFASLTARMIERGFLKLSDE